MSSTNESEKYEQTQPTEGIASTPLEGADATPIENSRGSSSSGGDNNSSTGSDPIPDPEQEDRLQAIQQFEEQQDSTEPSERPHSLSENDVSIGAISEGERPWITRAVFAVFTLLRIWIYSRFLGYCVRKVARTVFFDRKTEKSLIRRYGFRLTVFICFIWMCAALGICVALHLLVYRTEVYVASILSGFYVGAFVNRLLGKGIKQLSESRVFRIGVEELLTRSEDEPRTVDLLEVTGDRELDITMFISQHSVFSPINDFYYELRKMSFPSLNDTIIGDEQARVGKYRDCADVEFLKFEPAPFFNTPIETPEEFFSFIYKALVACTYNFPNVYDPDELDLSADSRIRNFWYLMEIRDPDALDHYKSQAWQIKEKLRALSSQCYCPEGVAFYGQLDVWYPRNELEEIVYDTSNRSLVGKANKVVHAHRFSKLERPFLIILVMCLLTPAQADVHDVCIALGGMYTIIMNSLFGLLWACGLRRYHGTRGRTLVNLSCGLLLAAYNSISLFGLIFPRGSELVLLIAILVFMRMLLGVISELKPILVLLGPIVGASYFPVAEAAASSGAQRDNQGFIIALLMALVIYLFGKKRSAERDVESGELRDATSDEFRRIRRQFEDDFLNCLKRPQHDKEQFLGLPELAELLSSKHLSLLGMALLEKSFESQRSKAVWWMCWCNSFLQEVPSSFRSHVTAQLVAVFGPTISTLNPWTTQSNMMEHIHERLDRDEGIPDWFRDFEFSVQAIAENRRSKKTGHVLTVVRLLSAFPVMVCGIKDPSDWKEVWNVACSMISETTSTAMCQAILFFGEVAARSQIVGFAKAWKMSGEKTKDDFLIVQKGYELLLEGTYNEGSGIDLIVFSAFAHQTLATAEKEIRVAKKSELPDFEYRINILRQITTFLRNRAIAGGARPEAMVVTITGPPGIGKTTAITTLEHMFHSMMGIRPYLSRGTFTPASDYHDQIFPYNTSIVGDDINNIKTEFKRKTFMEDLINFVNSKASPLRKARLELKESVANHVMMFLNGNGVDLGLTGETIEPGSGYRRLGYILEMSYRDDCPVKDGKVDYIAANALYGVTPPGTLPKWAKYVRYKLKAGESGGYVRENVKEMNAEEAQLDLANYCRAHMEYCRDFNQVQDAISGVKFSDEGLPVEQFGRLANSYYDTMYRFMNTGFQWILTNENTHAVTWGELAWAYFVSGFAPWANAIDNAYLITHHPLTIAMLLLMSCSFILGGIGPLEGMCAYVVQPDIVVQTPGPKLFWL
jgi:ABC-type multidrug transport system fused ATPase/permease subunit